MWKSCVSENKVVLKKSLNMWEGKCPFEKKSQIKLVITFNWNQFPEMFPHLDKHSWGISYECLLSGQPEPILEEIARLCLCHTIFRNV